MDDCTCENIINAEYGQMCQDCGAYLTYEPKSHKILQIPLKVWGKPVAWYRNKCGQRMCIYQQNPELVLPKEVYVITSKGKRIQPVKDKIYMNCGPSLYPDSDPED